jgi:hypothetical protein
MIINDWICDWLNEWLVKENKWLIKVYAMNYLFEKCKWV